MAISDWCLETVQVRVYCLSSVRVPLLLTVTDTDGTVEILKSLWSLSATSFDMQLTNLYFLLCSQIASGSSIATADTKLLFGMGDIHYDDNTLYLQH